MVHIKYFTATVVKKAVPPELFYSTYLEGDFGKHTGGGWHAWSGLCPFHDDKRAGSLVVNKVTGAYKCFSCGAGGGDILDFMMQKSGLPFSEVLKTLGGSVNA
tara:strand:- start:143495 stop:143803 length:309 start_codon:yes stop_codon:yes gene_type:complete